MEGLFRNKYKIESTRLPGYDYTSSGYYFITICTYNRIECLGEVMIDNNRAASVALSPIGEIVRDGLLNIPAIYVNVRLDTWIIMPNHIHIIFEITSPARNTSLNGFVETPHWGVSGQPNKHEIINEQKSTNGASNIIALKTPSIAINETPQWGVSTGEQNPQHHPEWKPGVLGSIINQFKGAVTKQCREFGYDFHWQSRFYGHIVRNEISLQKIREYIKNNPKMWYRDRNNAEGLLMS